MYFPALTLLALSAVHALPVPRATAPKGWATDYLESYDVYHTRYVALGCQAKHNTDFFDSCCHPLLATESLASRPAQCNPSGASTPAATKPQSTPKASSTVAAQAASTHAASSSAVQSGGFATFFYQNGVAGACGTVHKDTDFVAAIDADRYGDLGARSSLCGKQVQITNTKNGKSVTVTIADACPTCENSNSIDLSKSAFESIATDEEGMVPIKWSFL